MEAIEEQIPAAEMERMMKAQEVILKAAAGKLTWMAAAEIMGVTDRTMRRWRERLNEHGYSGLWDYRKRRPSPKRVPMATVEQVLQLWIPLRKLLRLLSQHLLRRPSLPQSQRLLQPVSRLQWMLEQAYQVRRQSWQSVQEQYRGRQ